MGALLTAPIGETGLLIDPLFPGLIQEAMTATVSDVFIFSHGWMTDADHSMIDYNRFVLGFNRSVEAVASVPGRLTVPTNSVAIGLHWPSMYSENDTALNSIFSLASFHTMEVRTYAVGNGGGKQILETVWRWVIAHPTAELRLHLVGHSFGCRVVCSSLVSAMNDVGLLRDFLNRKQPIPINLALLERAMPHDVLGPGRPYATLQNYGSGLRILTTRSDLDSALMNPNFYPATEAVQPADQFDLSAQGAGNILGPHAGIPALGGQGPDAATLAAYNDGDQTIRTCSVGPNFQQTNVHWQTHRILVADLTPLHLAHRQQDQNRAPGAPVPPGRPAHATDPSGYHSDIYCDEVYQLLIGALFS